MPKIIHTTDDGDEITDLEFLVGLVEKTARMDIAQAEKSFTVRLALNTAAQIDAMAQHSGQTRNLLCAEFLEFAVSEVSAKLSPKARKEIRGIQARLLDEYVQLANSKGGE